ncbi:MAG: YdcF family protein [Candidatus Azambacteria bacterium]|nr:YdcF family protein [Candidatus Azambacteria bacterium]
MESISNRKSSVELPEIRELGIILEREAKRQAASRKENEHFADFGLSRQWFKLLGLPADIFEKNLTWQELVVLGAEIQEQVVSKTLKLIQEGNSEVKELMQKITLYLGEEDEPQKSDVIFVFGSKSLMRIETAVNLYKQGLSPKIFITGSMPIYEKREKPEAHVFRDWAVEHGVPAEDIAIHDTAISVADNVRGGLNVMDSLELPHNSMILVTAWFAMRRSWAHMMKYVPENTKLYRVSAPVTSTGNFTPDGWWKNEIGVKTIFNEFGKMKISEILNSS